MEGCIYGYPGEYRVLTVVYIKTIMSELLFVNWKKSRCGHRCKCAALVL